MPCLSQMFEAKHPERYTNAVRAPAPGDGPLWKVFGMQFRCTTWGPFNILVRCQPDGVSAVLK